MWQYKNKNIEDNEIPEKAIGFIYLIECSVNNRKYIGRKLLTKAGYKTTKGKKTKIRKPNDWQSYFGSSPELLSDIEIHGKECFKRTVLYFCESLIALTYSEEAIQYSLGVIESPLWYNSNIRMKMFRNMIHKKVNLDDLRSTILNLIK